MLPRARRNRRLSMTALVDVIFLLLLFFMLSSTFSRFSELPISNGAAGASDANLDRLGILRIGEEDLLLNGIPSALGDLIEALQDLEIEVLAVSPQEAVNAQRLTDLLATMRAAPDIEVVLLAGPE